MPGMTMVFKIVDTKLPDTLKEGDKVKFAAYRDFDGVVVVRRSRVGGCPLRGIGGRTILINRGLRPEGITPERSTTHRRRLSQS